MTKNKLKIALGVFGGTALLLAAPVFAVLAQTASSTDASTGTSTARVAGDKGQGKTQAMAQRIALAKNHANQEIRRRISGLTSLIKRLGLAKRISADEKASLTATVQKEIDNLTALQSKIAADSDIATLKTDIQSITKAYRIFALIMPQGRIAAAADQMKTTADMVVALGVKLQVRITAAQSAGTDMSASQTLLSDLNAKAADAKVQADAALSLISALVPDNGDQTVLQSNQQALKAARAKIQAGHADLQAAEKDVRSIIQTLKQMKVHTKTASSTPEERNE